MFNGEPRRLSLEVELAPLCGRLHDETGSAVEFRGWLELAAALERLLGSQPAGDPAGHTNTTVREV